MKREKNTIFAFAMLSPALALLGADSKTVLKNTIQFKRRTI